MCCSWPVSNFTWSKHTIECLWIRSKSRIKAFLHSWCCYCLYHTFNPSGNWNEGPWSTPSLCEWCADWWIPKVSGTRFQWDHACHKDRVPIWCHPPNYNSFAIGQSYQLLRSEKAYLRRVWGPEYLTIDYTAEAPPWGLSCPEYSYQEQSICD